MIRNVDRRSKDSEKVAECDGCGSEEYSGALDFKEFVDWLRQQGWRISKVNDEWTHVCPNCK